MNGAAFMSKLAQELAEVETLTMGNFDRDLLVNPGVVREVHRSETAAAEWCDDLVLSECLTPE